MTAEEYQDRMASLKSHNNQLQKRVAELTAEIEGLRRVRQTADIYITAKQAMDAENTAYSERVLKVLEHLVKMTETTNNQIFKDVGKK